MPSPIAGIDPSGAVRARSLWAWLRPTSGGSGPRRWWLWALLLVLVLLLLVVLIWLAGRYEVSRAQERLERDTADAIGDIRGALTRNAQSLQALQSANASDWEPAANQLLQQHHEWLRIEWRNSRLDLLHAADTPYRTGVFERMGRDNSLTDVALACASARRFGTAAYAPSYFLPQSDGLGLEVMELCLPLGQQAKPSGYVIASYALQEVLENLIDSPLSRGREVSFTEADGTRLAVFGSARRGSRMFTAHQLLDLPGHTLLLRIDSWRGAPDLFPNVLTALVTAMTLALLTVLFLLAKDTRRRIAVEQELAQALAFRKAMEDSLITGLRARDLQGRITYVNPAFCQMVGYSSSELLGHGSPAPYWPADRANEYAQRQSRRLRAGAWTAQGTESVFQRKSGQLFQVLIVEAPLIDAQGQQTGWMGAILDISEQRRIEELSRTSHERLQATARLATVGEMASLLSHELNQPLAAIASYATGSLNLLGDQAGAADASILTDLRLAMQRIAAQAERAGKVIRSVHDFVRRRDQSRVAVTVSDLLDAILPLVNLQARKLQVQVQLDLPTHLPPVHCDRTMIEQVLLNLARNAMQAMDQPQVQRRQLVVRVRPQPTEGGGPATRLEFAVIDFGTGLSAAVVEQLGTPFFTTKADGMGLGLSLCRTVVEQHGGELRFAAQSPCGTIFSFSLPIADAPLPQACALPSAGYAESLTDATRH